MLLLPLIVCKHQQPTSHPPVLPLCQLNGELDRTNSQKYRELVRKYQFAVLRGVKRILSAKQLEESKALNDQQQKNFIDEIQKEQKEQLHAKIVQLEKQLDVKQKLELEIQQLKGSLSVLKQIQDDKDAEVLMKEDALQKELEEKELSLQDLDALNQVLIIKERERNDELQEARGSSKRID